MSTESRTRRWIGIALSALPILFLAFDSTIKLIKIPPVVQSFAELGFPDEMAVGIGLLELACVLLYAFPRTSALGAVLLTAFLGGAIAVKVRIAAPLFSHTLFPIYVALPIWLGLYLRDDRLATLLPIRRGDV